MVLHEILAKWRGREGGRGRGEEKNFAHFSKGCTIQHCSTLSESVLTHWCYNHDSCLFSFTGAHWYAWSNYSIYAGLCVYMVVKIMINKSIEIWKRYIYSVVGGIAVRCQPESCCWLSVPVFHVLDDSSIIRSMSLCGAVRDLIYGMDLTAVFFSSCILRLSYIQLSSLCLAGMLSILQ